MQRFDALLPLKAKQVLPRMIADNWLVNYQHLEGINMAMQGMARRASFRSEMARATDDLQKDYGKFENDFRQFFPELARHATSCLHKIEEAGLRFARAGQYTSGLWTRNHIGQSPHRSS